jgi:hypothetical protein
MFDGTRPDAPQLCPCGLTPLQCAVATLGAVRDELTADPRGSPGEARPTTRAPWSVPWPWQWLPGTTNSLRRRSGRATGGQVDEHRPDA